VKHAPKAVDPLAGIDATIFRLQQMEDWASCLRATRCREARRPDKPDTADRDRVPGRAHGQGVGCYRY